jgi:hypothetical protein
MNNTMLTVRKKTYVEAAADVDSNRDEALAEADLAERLKTPPPSLLTCSAIHKCLNLNHSTRAKHKIL